MKLEQTINFKHLKTQIQWFSLEVIKLRFHYLFLIMTTRNLVSGDSSVIQTSLFLHKKNTNSSITQHLSIYMSIYPSIYVCSAIYLSIYLSQKHNPSTFSISLPCLTLFDLQSCFPQLSIVRGSSPSAE